MYVICMTVQIPSACNYVLNDNKIFSAISLLARRRLGRCMPSASTFSHEPTHPCQLSLDSTCTLPFFALKCTEFWSFDDVHYQDAKETCRNLIGRAKGDLGGRYGYI